MDKNRREKHNCSFEGTVTETMSTAPKSGAFHVWHTLGNVHNAETLTREVQLSTARLTGM